MFCFNKSIIIIIEGEAVKNRKKTKRSPYSTSQKRSLENSFAKSHLISDPNEMENLKEQTGLTKNQVNSF